MDHLDENAILELLEHRMPKERRAEAERHLDGCATCLELLAILAADAPVPPELGPTDVDLTRHVVASRLSPGDRIDRFVLERIVGEGGMGVVWAASDESGAPVALKILKEVSAAERKRFLREARLLESFEHPAIVDVREVLGVGDDIVLVMDLLDGESLGARLSREGSLDIATTLAILGPLVDAVAAAHARGIVHRDLKPENVFLLARGGLRLLDFGMAKLTGVFDLAVSGWLTESGLVLGTPHYMAPEQIVGERDVDARADVWALGVIAYECLSGVRPVQGRSFGQILRALERREIVDLAERAPGAPPALVDVVRRMLAHERAARASLGELRAVIDQLGPQKSFTVATND